MGKTQKRHQKRRWTMPQPRIVFRGKDSIDGQEIVGISIPNLVALSNDRQRDSVALLRCPNCHAEKYAPQAYFDQIARIEKQARQNPGVEDSKGVPMCRSCKVLCEVVKLEGDHSDETRNR